MADSSLHDEVVKEIEPHGNAEESIKALCLMVADRIQAARGSEVLLGNLVDALRHDPDAIVKAVMANTPAEKTPAEKAGK
jgi:hypothetical protein